MLIISEITMHGRTVYRLTSDQGNLALRGTDVVMSEAYVPHDDLHRGRGARRTKVVGNTGAYQMSTLVGKGVRFERIRRITGYLVGTTEKFNSAKQAEERDRVKHAYLQEDRNNDKNRN